ncbi:MAG: TrbI/VirB10 family protein [Hyphomonadaceae bacterium]|nr:TrbI/VirB10 family protein [Hyphomonadaceae bacterium]
MSAADQPHDHASQQAPDEAAGDARADATSQEPPRPGTGPTEAPDGAADIADFDRPMRDAPAPRRLAPAALVAVGAGGIAWALSLALAGPAAPTRLEAPVTEIEYSTGVVADLPAPRNPPPANRAPPPAPAAPAWPAGVARGAAAQDAADLKAAAQKLADARRHAPVLLIGADRGGREAAPIPSSPPPASLAAADAEPSSAASARVDAIRRAQRAATRADVTLPEGAFIAATLETAIQSDLPGSIRAVVARDVYAADGTRVLIPRGSRLVGAYRAGLVRGQSRVFASWTRMIRPDGVSVALDAPAADGAGRAGAAGRRDTHFLERFGAGVLLSLIDGAVVAAANNAGDRDETRIVLQSGGDFSGAAAIALANAVDIAPTVHVAPGTRLQVFVNRDIDFSGVVATQAPPPEVDLR